MGRIPDHFIQDLLARADIVAVVEPCVPLKRAGSEFAGLCPFHQEKSPSFTVSPQKQFFHCFGCGAHGNAIGFLMQFDHLEFVDAVEELASRMGMDVPREGGAARPQTNPDFYSLMAEATQLFRSQLQRTRSAQDYLERRGISAEIADRFQIGLSPDGWTVLQDRLGGNASANAMLEELGLLARRESGETYDKFRNRIMFPIHDTRGRPIAFGGRLYLEDAKGPKYLNSPETPLFHKSSQLYGLYQARQSGRLERLLVVEGYMDVVALAQFGFDESVATLGTATTADHARILFRSSPEAVFCFDGDRAGRQAAIKAMHNILPQLGEGRQARFLFLPDGEDPDSLVRSEGESGLRDRLARAVPFSEFFFAHLREDIDTTSLDGRASLMARAKPLIAEMPAGALRTLMSERLAELTRSNSATARPTTARSRTRSGNFRDRYTRDRSGKRRFNNDQDRDSTRGQPLPRTQRLNAVRDALKLLIHSPQLANDFDIPESYPRAGIDLLREVMGWCQSAGESNTAQLLAHFSEHEHARSMARLAASRTLENPDQLRADLSGYLNNIEAESLRWRLTELKERARTDGMEAVRQMHSIRTRLDELAEISAIDNPDEES